MAYAAAAPGATITIAPGTYTTGILVTRSATLTRCGATGEVILQADASATSPDNYQFIISEDGVDTTPYTITLENLVFRGNGPVGNDCLLLSKTIGNVSFVVNGGAGRETSSVFCLGGGDHVVSNMSTDLTVGSAFTGDFSYVGSGSITATNCQLQSQDATFFVDGNWGPAQRADTTFSFTNCTFTSVNAAGVDIGGGLCSFTGCTVSGCGDGGCFLNDGDFTFTDCTITGNSSATDYSAIYVSNLTNDPSSLTIAGTTTVTGNTTASGPGGIGIDNSGFGPVTVTGATTSNVFGNTSPYQCATFNNTAWVDNPTCSF